MSLGRDDIFEQIYSIFPASVSKNFLPQFKSDSGGETSGNHDAFTEHHKMLTYKAENYVMYHFVLNQMPSHARVSGDEEWQVPNVPGEKRRVI